MSVPVHRHSRFLAVARTLSNGPKNQALRTRIMACLKLWMVLQSDGIDYG